MELARETHLINGQELGVDLDGTLLIASTADVLVASNVVVVTGAMLTPHIGALLAATRLLVVAVERENKQKELKEQQK